MLKETLHKMSLYSIFLLELSFIVVFISPCVFVALFWMICRASEQKRINVTEHFNSSLPQQLDLDLYLGVYAGEPCQSTLLFVYY